MGSKGGGATSTSSSGPPPQVLAEYQNIVNQAKNVAATPLQQYTGPTLAGFTPMQEQAFTNINNAQGAYQPYFNSAQGLIGQGTQAYNPTQFSQGAIDQYMNPYTQDVINATLANANIEDAKQQSSLQGNAIARGAWGGDRADLARNDLARNQALARNQTIAGLNNQNYSQALNQFNTANQAGLQAAGLNNQSALQGAGLYGTMGNSAQQNALAASAAQLGAGQLQQQLVQNQLNIPYQMFQEQQEYPFKTTGWLSNIVQGIGNQSGQTGTTTQPQGSNISSALGLGFGAYGLASGAGLAAGTSGLLGGGAALLGLLSDERAKDNINKVGELDNGLPVYSYNYKGDNRTQIGLLAQDVEKEKPEAVGNAGGLKTVDYAEAVKGYAGGGIVPDFSRSYVPEISPLNIQPQHWIAPPPIEKDTSGDKNLALGLGILGKNRKLGSDIDESFADNPEIFGSQFGVDRDLNSAFKQNPELFDTNKGLFDSLFSGYADGGNVMQEVKDFNPIVAGTKVYGVDPDVIRNMGKTVSTPIGSGINQGVHLTNNSNSQANSITPSGINLLSPNEFSQYYYNTPSFQTQFGLTPGVHVEYNNGGFDNPTYVNSADQAYNMYKMNPSGYGFATGGGIKGYKNAGSVYGPGIASSGEIYPTGYKNDLADQLAMLMNSNAASPEIPETNNPLDISALNSGTDISEVPLSSAPSTGGLSQPLPVAQAQPASGASLSGLDDLKRELAENEPVLDKDLALAQAGFAMAAGQSPNALQNISSGALAGLQNYAQQKKDIQEYKMKKEVADREARRIAETAQYHRDMVDVARGRLANAPGNMFKYDPNIENSDLTGDDLLGQLDPKTAAIVKAAANGEIPVNLTKNNPTTPLISIIKKYDPEFTADRYILRKSFDSGKDAQTIESLNMTSGHIGQMLDAAKALDNGDVQSVNKITNSIATELGDPDLQSFDAVKKAVASEAVRVFRGSGGTGEEVKEIQSAINNASSPKQIAQVSKELLKLMHSRIEAKENTYKRVMGKNSDTSKFYSPETIARFEESGIKVPGVKSENKESGSVKVKLKSTGQLGVIPRDKLKSAIASGLYEEIE